MKHITFLVLLILFSLACSLTTPPSPPQDVPAQMSNKTHLATATPDPTPIPRTMPATCTVSAYSLHLRECAGLQCAVLAWLSADEVLEVLDADRDWRDFGGLPQYVMGEWRDDLLQDRALHVSKTKLPFDPKQYPPKPKKDKIIKPTKPKSSKPRFSIGEKDEDTWSGDRSEGEE
jgi:hypothetical protein